MKDKDDLLDIKITLVGDSGVGKTSIIGRFVTGIFISDTNSSSGLSYSQKELEKNKKQIRLNLWDTVGQEKYRALGKNFYKDSFLILIVYDISNRQSFENIKNIWYPDINENGEKIKHISIVGNKIDKYEEEEVKEEEARSYAKEIDADFFLVSANKGKGIEEMFDSLVDKYFEEEFMNKVDESREERVDSIFLHQKSMSQSKSFNTCC